MCVCCMYTHTCMYTQLESVIEVDYRECVLLEVVLLECVLSEGVRLQCVLLECVLSPERY